MMNFELTCEITMTGTKENFGIIRCCSCGEENFIKFEFNGDPKSDELTRLVCHKTTEAIIKMSHILKKKLSPDGKNDGWKFTREMCS